MKIKLSKSQWEGIGKKAGWIRLSAPVMPPFRSSKAKEALQHLRSRNFDISSVPPSCIETISQDPRLSWTVARKLKFNNVPYSIINSISQNLYISYLWAKHVNFDIDKIPQPIQDKINEDSEELLPSNYKRYYDKGIKNFQKRNLITI